MMERNIEKHLDDTFKIPGVSGVICTDAHGLCLGAKGVATREDSGHIANIAEMASRLFLNLPNPVISISGEAETVLIQKEEDITMAIYKTPN